MIYGSVMLIVGKKRTASDVKSLRSHEHTKRHQHLGIYGCGHVFCGKLVVKPVEANLCSVRKVYEPLPPESGTFHHLSPHFVIFFWGGGKKQYIAK